LAGPKLFVITEFHCIWKWNVTWGSQKSTKKIVTYYLNGLLGGLCICVRTCVCNLAFLTFFIFRLHFFKSSQMLTSIFFFIFFKFWMNLNDNSKCYFKNICYVIIKVQKMSIIRKYLLYNLPNIKNCLKSKNKNSKSS